MKKIILILLLFSVLLGYSFAQTASASLGSDNATVGIGIIQSSPLVGFTVSGTSSSTLIPEGSIDGLSYTTLSAYPQGSATGTSAITTTGTWHCPAGGYSFFRIRQHPFSSGSFTVIIHATASDGTGASGGSGGSGGSITGADGAIINLGNLADPKNSATDTTPLGLTAILKQISYDMQLLATLMGTNGIQALDGSQVLADAGGLTVKSVFGGGKTLKKKTLSTSSSGDTQLLAAVSGKKFYVVSIFCMAKGDTDVSLTDGASGTILDMGYPTTRAGWIDKGTIATPATWSNTANTDLTVNNSAAVAITITITYYEE